MGRALDCVHPAHDDVHFTAEDDDGLFGQIQEHRDEYHSEISNDEIRDGILPNAYDEQVA